MKLRQKEKKVGKAERAKERDGQMSWDPARCTPGRVELSPEKLIRDARVECSGWGYHATAMGSPPLDGEHRRYFEFKIDWNSIWHQQNGHILFHPHGHADLSLPDFFC